MVHLKFEQGVLQKFIIPYQKFFCMYTESMYFFIGWYAPSAEYLKGMVHWSIKALNVPYLKGSIYAKKLPRFFDVFVSRALKIMVYDISFAKFGAYELM